LELLKVSRADLQSLRIGTPGYQSPERSAIQQWSNDSKMYGIYCDEDWDISIKGYLAHSGCDYFSLGYILFILYFCGPPFEAATWNNFYFSKFCQDRQSFWEIHLGWCKRSDTIDPRLIELLNGLLAPDIETRWIIEDIRKSRYYEESCSPEFRLAAQHALRNHNLDKLK